MIYFDTSYLVRLYLAEPGFEAVRRLAAADSLACSVLGRAETIAAFHRKLRERSLTAGEYRTLRSEFDKDCAAEAFHWLPLSAAIVERVQRVFDTLPASAFLRAADALHLAAASESGFTSIHSNDRHLLACAKHFGLEGRNMI